MKILIAALGLTLAPSVRAEMVMILHSAKVEVGTETVKGYLVLPYRKDLDLKTKEGVDYVRTLDYKPSVFDSIEETAPMPAVGPLRIVIGKRKRIDNSKVRTITPLGWPLDGKEQGSDIMTVSLNEAKLLKNPPLAFCKSRIWDGSYWISYNPKVDQARLETLCNRTFDTRPTDEETAKVLAEGKVIHYHFLAD